MLRCINRVVSCFFFSSRRRHTRLTCDWSSDVCSSDLDGLVHISKLGRGKRVERVEDVLNLGDEITVRVDDIDPQGKVSLTPVGDGDDGGDGGGGGGRESVPAAVSSSAG